MASPREEITTDTQKKEEFKTRLTLIRKYLDSHKEMTLLVGSLKKGEHFELDVNNEMGIKETISISKKNLNDFTSKLKLEISALDKPYGNALKRKKRRGGRAGGGMDVPHFVRNDLVGFFREATNAGRIGPIVPTRPYSSSTNDYITNRLTFTASEDTPVTITNTLISLFRIYATVNNLLSEATINKNKDPKDWNRGYYGADDFMKINLASGLEGAKRASRDKVVAAAKKMGAPYEDPIGRVKWVVDPHTGIKGPKVSRLLKWDKNANDYVMRTGKDLERIRAKADAEGYLPQDRYSVFDPENFQYVQFQSITSQYRRKPETAAEEQLISSSDDTENNLINSYTEKIRMKKDAMKKQLVDAKKTGIPVELEPINFEELAKDVVEDFYRDRNAFDQVVQQYPAFGIRIRMNQELQMVKQSLIHRIMSNEQGITTYV